MKKRFIAIMLAALMAVCAVPVSAMAADALTFTDSTGINTNHYSFTLYNGDDYITNVLEGADKNKTQTVEKGETATFVLNAGTYESATYPNVDFSQHTTGSYHYGASNKYCIATDSAFTLTGDGVTASVSGFGSKTYSGDSNYGGYKSNKSIATTFTVDTANLAAGTYTLSLSYKYQMKKDNWGYKTAKEYAGTIDGIKLVVTESKQTESIGASIRVGDKAGLRFGFTTNAAQSDVAEYGFLYSKENVSADDMKIESAGSNGVYKKVATNYLYHADGDYTSFNLVFVNIKSANYSTKIYSRSYVVLNDGTVLYSDVASYCFNDVANAVLADSDVDDATKDSVRAMVNA